MRTITSPGHVDERYYDPTSISHKFAVGERIEWVDWVTDSDDGLLSIYQAGTILRITPWTVLLRLLSGQETRIDKSYLYNRAGHELREAVAATLQDATIEYAKKKLTAINPSVIGAKQCILCEKHYNSCDFSRIAVDICTDCYKRTTNKIGQYNNEARKFGGQTGLQTVEWIEKLKQSQGRCHYCHAYYGLSHLIIEHATPISWGGNNTKENVVPACIGCNSSKGDRDVETWNRHCEAKRLTERLQKHFNLSKFEVTNLAIRLLAEHEGLLEDDVTEAAS